MSWTRLFSRLLLITLPLTRCYAIEVPSKIYGVNLGSWYDAFSFHIIQTSEYTSMIEGWLLNLGWCLKVYSSVSLYPLIYSRACSSRMAWYGRARLWRLFSMYSLRIVSPYPDIWILRSNISISAYAQAYPDTVDATFANHWLVASHIFFNFQLTWHVNYRTTWFTQEDVDTLSAAGINTVRIPVCVCLSSLKSGYSHLLTFSLGTGLWSP